MPRARFAETRVIVPFAAVVTLGSARTGNSSGEGALMVEALRPRIGAFGEYGAETAYLAVRIRPERS